MSGGKESPRQKMIGMMYLVLTALLALQVSNSVLEKFIFINDTLEVKAVEDGRRNTQTLQRIEAEVKKKGDRPQDLKALDKAKKVREMTAAMMTELRALKEEFVAITGGRDDNGNLVGAKDYDKVSSLMIYGGKGKELKDKMNEYSKQLSEIAGEDFEPLAKDASEINIAKNDPNQNMKKFAEYYFENTPTAAGMATITTMETEVLAYEQVALEDLAEQVGAKDISFDMIYPIVLPRSNIVAAGTKFQGDLFITARSSAISPEMAINKNTGGKYPDANDEELKVEDGQGLVEFTATPGAYNKDGRAEKKFMTYITMNDSTYEHEHIYYVSKPIIQILSAAISSLYFNCGNELNVLVPALGLDYNPSFSATGGVAIKGAKKGLVTIIPTGKTVKLTVRSSGNLIGTETFSVKPIPKPHLEISDRGKRINLKTGVKVPGPLSISMRAISDETFKDQLPKDARYRVTEWEIILARGSRPVKRETIKNKQDLAMNQYRALAKPGDRIVIEVKKVMRMNYQNKRETVRGIANTVFTIPLNQ